ncbi:hypothetical protein MNBD_ALPHA11-1024 [hydrothermal vent metagenome]|uniref:Uncharacterized protein n=1 Tax=hydrothermal vent metagenome TaxID=652676 RepID=A0A3B0U590_9ZZZZ
MQLLRVAFGKSLSHKLITNPSQLFEGALGHKESTMQNNRPILSYKTYQVYGDVR